MRRGCTNEKRRRGFAAALHCARSIAAGSIQPRLDDRRERVACAIQPGLHCAEIAIRDLRDLFVRLALQLSEHEHLPVMFRKLSHGLLDETPEMSLAKEVVRTCRR